MRFSLLTSLLASLAFASNAYAATLNVVGGQLMGASNVLVGGSLYDVQFLDGSCIDLYNGCDDVSDFTFQTEASALLASQALLDQVFLDGGSGQFISQPQLTNGCESIYICLVHTHYLPTYYFYAQNEIVGYSTGDGTHGPEYWPYTNVPLANLENADTVAVWAPVPEPSTALLLGLGLTGFAGKGRRLRA